MDDGYIMLSRRFFASEKWQAARAFSDCEAWLDLIQSARFEASPTTSRIGCYEVTWNRGQYPASNRFLARKWGRSEQWVKSFLGKLKREKMITTDNSQGVNVITLVNYDKYNGKTANNLLDNPSNNPLNQLTVNELQALVTHLVTQLATHPEKQQPTCNPNNKKEEESKEISNTPKVVLDKKKAAKAVSEKSDPASAAQSNFQRIFDYFNTKMDGKAIKTISRLTDKRKSMVRARCSEYGLQSVYDVIDKAAKSLFLNGNNDRGWTADFDWIFRPNNFPKVLEGNYDKANRPQKPNTEREKLASAVEIKAEYGHDDTSYGKFMVFLSERATYICEHYVLPTRELFENLVDKMGKRNVMDTVMALENNYYERRKYTNLYETLNELNIGDKT